jgi:hypothetical protein
VSGTSLAADSYGLGPAGSFGRDIMFLAIAAVLVVLWLLGFLAFHIAGGLIHILLVLAIIAVIWNFVAGRRGI